MKVEYIRSDRAWAVVEDDGHPHDTARFPCRRDAEDWMRGIESAQERIARGWQDHNVGMDWYSALPVH